MKVSNDVCAGGTHLIGHVKVAPKRLVEILGEPCGLKSYKTSKEWILTGETGRVFTIYDYAKVGVRDNENEFWSSDEPIWFDVAGHNLAWFTEVGQWLMNKPGVNEVVSGPYAYNLGATL